MLQSDLIQIKLSNLLDLLKKGVDTAMASNGEIFGIYLVPIKKGRNQIAHARKYTYKKEKASIEKWGIRFQGSGLWSGRRCQKYSQKGRSNFYQHPTGPPVTGTKPKGESFQKENGGRRPALLAPRSVHRVDDLRNDARVRQLHITHRQISTLTLGNPYGKQRGDSQSRYHPSYLPLR